MAPRATRHPCLKGSLHRWEGGAFRQINRLFLTSNLTSSLSASLLLQAPPSLSGIGVRHVLSCSLPWMGSPAPLRSCWGGFPQPGAGWEPKQVGGSRVEIRPCDPACSVRAARTESRRLRGSRTTETHRSLSWSLEVCGQGASRPGERSSSTSQASHCVPLWVKLLEFCVIQRSHLISEGFSYFTKVST